MTSRRCLLLLAPLLFLTTRPCAAATAVSLADRIAIDGDLSDWAPDEWVLDSTSPEVESSGDSWWGPHEDLLRVGVTWDAQYLYIAVEFLAQSSTAFVALGYAPGGFASLDGAGEFRRAIDFPFGVNVMALANRFDAPTLARVDDRGVLRTLDLATAPAAVRAPLEGALGFEVALPWSLLSIDDPLQLAIALTGDEGTGAGDTAPRPSTDLPRTPGPESKTRAPLDRWLSIPADGDDDGVVDVGVSPRDVVVVAGPEWTGATQGESVKATMVVTPRLFAPDNGEDATFSVAFESDLPGGVFATARVYSIDGRLVRVLYEDVRRDLDESQLVASSDDRWDGRDGDGRVVAGGVYAIVFEWGRARGEKSGRAKAGVAVAR